MNFNAVALPVVCVLCFFFFSVLEREGLGWGKRLGSSILCSLALLISWILSIYVFYQTKWFSLLSDMRAFKRSPGG